MPSRNFTKTLAYLDAIDQGGGASARMAFYNIAGNEENLARWEKKLCLEWRLVLKNTAQDGRVTYAKTDLGNQLHSLLRNHQFLGGLFEELIRNRLS